MHNMVTFTLDLEEIVKNHPEKKGLAFWQTNSKCKAIQVKKKREREFVFFRSFE